MIIQETGLLTVEPIISYPRNAEIGKSYLLSIDLRPSMTKEDEWPLEGEECVVYCLLSTAPLFSNQALGEPAVVVHRYGGSYGPATFLLKAAEEEMVGTIRITLVNGWGIPLTELLLPGIRLTKQDVTESPSSVLPTQDTATAPDSITPASTLRDAIWQGGIVRILNQSGDTVGAGFVVTSDGLIATCAHVLGPSKPEKVFVVFQGSGEQREALVEGWLAEDAEDIAFLKVSGGMPVGVLPLPLGSSFGTEGHSLTTFGYPKLSEIEGVRGTGTILGHGTITRTGQPLLQLRSSEITKGFSGAPVWDEVRKRVVGMVIIAAERDALGKFSEIVFATPTETLRKTWPALQITDLCPYRNLEAFTEADAAFFFGRQRVVDSLVENLQNEPRFLAVLGASGSGKSSVVQAGLIPQLRNGVVPGSDRWDIIATRPLDSSFKQVPAQLNQTPAPAALVIDQFEELFVSYDEAARAEVITQLVGLMEHSPHVTLILVMRDDFYSLFVRHEALAQLLKGRLVNVWPTMKREEVEVIVRGPATSAGWQFEDGLIETIVNDVLKSATKGRRETASSAILPLLEFALTQLWERRQDGVLTHDAYRRIGGITGGLSQWADAAYYAFDERLRPLVRRVFTDLVYLGNEEEHIADSRRRRKLSSLVHTQAEQADIQQVIQRLVAARLLIVSQDTKSQQETIEIINDALLWEWRRLSEWVEEDRRFLLWHQELEKYVQAWIDSNRDDPTRRDPYRLFRGTALTEAKQWLKERPTYLSKVEQEFIQASENRGLGSFLRNLWPGNRRDKREDIE